VTEPLRAGIYCRLSQARDGDTTKVDDQARICRDLGERLGWVPAQGCGHPEPNGVYTDNSKSAWRRDRKRPGWDKMLADVGSGKLAALIVYHGDRLVRQPRDLEDLLDLAHGKGIRLASPTGTRGLDDDEAQFILGIEANMARRESANISRRMKAGIARRKRAGIVNSGGRGGRLFGFQTDGLTHDHGEAPVVGDVFGLTIAGHSKRGLAADLRAKGWLTTAGTPMHPLAIRRMIRNPRYAGLMPDGVTAGDWEPIVSREVWEAANAAMDGRSAPLGPGHTARRYLLSGIARCGVCGSPLQALPAYTSKWTGKPVRVAATYSCIQPGCRKVTRSVSLLDAYVTGRTAGRLANQANPDGHLPSVPGLAAEWRALADERAATEAMIADPAKGRHVHLLLARLDSLDGRLAELRELARGNADARLRGRHAGITLAEFLAEPLGTRRALVSACYEVVVAPASRRGPGFRTEDVRLVPRGRDGQVGGQHRGGDGDADPAGEGGDAADDPQVPGLAGLAVRDAGRDA
jgi:DNA invertase Pin-like site-specific DNA recombinase